MAGGELSRRDVYRVCERFPRTEIYDLTAELRRASVSVLSNIGEGQGRFTKGDFIQSLGQREVLCLNSLRTQK